jgi:hypothetical protein
MAGARTAGGELTLVFTTERSFEVRRARSREAVSLQSSFCALPYSAFGAIGGVFQEFQ